jgi:hypothetical protein
VRDLAVAVLSAMAVNNAGPDGAQLPVLFASPVRSAIGVPAPAVARDRGVGPPARIPRRTGDASPFRGTQTWRSG